MLLLFVMYLVFYFVSRCCSGGSCQPGHGSETPGARSCWGPSDLSYVSRLSRVPGPTGRGGGAGRRERPGGLGVTHVRWEYTAEVGEWKTPKLGDGEEEVVGGGTVFVETDSGGSRPAQELRVGTLCPVRGHLRLVPEGTSVGSVEEGRGRESVVEKDNSGDGGGDRGGPSCESHMVCRVEVK